MPRDRGVGGKIALITTLLVLDCQYLGATSAAQGSTTKKNFDDMNRVQLVRIIVMPVHERTSVLLLLTEDIQCQMTAHSYPRKLLVPQTTIDQNA